MKENFKFWVPLDNLQKAFDKNGNEIMKIGGIASTNAKDTDGEFLDPNGFNLDYFKQIGTINWHHQAKNNPAAIIGEPTLAEIRKEGLYVEGMLYPDSELAKSVYNTAKILENNSTSRRLGFSIEGRATKRKSMDEKHPDYKIIQKADITGLAITMQPKNPKTFLDIIKGNVEDSDVEEYDDETLAIIKALEAGSVTGSETRNISVPGSGAALKTDKKVKTKNINTIEEDEENETKEKKLTKAEVYEQIISKQPDISLLDAEKVFHYIKKINMKQDLDKVTSSDVEKALELLDKAQDLVKGGVGKKDDKDEDEDDVPKYSKDDKEDEGIKKAGAYCDSTMKKGKSKSEAMSNLISKGGYPADVIQKAFGKKEDKDDDDDSDEGKVKKFKKKKEEVDAMEKALIEKGLIEKPVVVEEKVIEKAIEGELNVVEGFDIQKGLDDVRELIKEKNYSVGVILKGVYDNMELVKGVVENLKEENANLQKALDENKETITDLNAKFTDLSKALDEPQGRKSVTVTNFRERNFSDTNNVDKNNLNKGGNGKTLSIKERKKVLDVLDHATFEKGLDNEFSAAMTTFESTGSIHQHIIQRLATEKGITITN